MSVKGCATQKRTRSTSYHSPLPPSPYQTGSVAEVHRLPKTSDTGELVFFRNKSMNDVLHSPKRDETSHRATVWPETIHSAVLFQPPLSLFFLVFI
ncbi:hypothetical protein CDAR_21401 [Caerostris darwini]|uniref:Uncharacterized protein n=1 Tax=Caerostris darwini TaxID=1538125 RepID=A0AAV4VZV4_9ARAC|nr:hypothetical protein CDAR_21401 [Caerostris darwini]